MLPPPPYAVIRPDGDEDSEHATFQQVISRARLVPDCRVRDGDFRLWTLREFWKIFTD
jgi:hypothetical protein